MGGSLSAPELEGLYYRFSVKCDRAMNASIEAAARNAGMSATSFVQQHFEGILSKPKAVPANAPAEIRRDRDVAQSLGISVSMLRVYRVMDQAKDGNGNVQLSQMKIGELAEVAPASVKAFQMKLARRKLMSQTAAPGHRVPAIWHVFSAGDDV